MQVYFNENALTSVREFFSMYEEMYFRLYDDTGLGPVEEYIKKAYHDSAIQMRDGLVDELYRFFTETEIIGYSPLPESRRLTMKTYGRYRVFVEYTEDSETRLIGSIKIYRK